MLARIQGKRPSDKEASSQDWLLEVFPEFWAPASSVASHRGSLEGQELPGVDRPLWAAFPWPVVSPLVGSSKAAEPTGRVSTERHPL